MKNKHTTSLRFLCTAALAALLLPACGPSGDEAGTGTSSTAADNSASGGTNNTATAERTIEFTANDQMQFNLESFEVEAGQTIEIHLDNVGSMPKMSMGHNVVILQPGTDEEAFVEAAMGAAANDYIPADQEDAVVAHTKMLGGGEEDSVTFTVPSEPGEYPFLCSFPGHYQVGMRGVMVVR